MRKSLTLLLAILLTTSMFAQAPEKMSYQAVIRDINDVLVINKTISMQISILKDSESGTVVYSETHSTNTNANGMISTEIGTGTTTDDFSTIDWANGVYFIKTESDINGGTNYSITGTSQLLSVPYALHAKTADITEIDPSYTSSEAAKITLEDINNLSELSGSNTGDQDLSTLSTKIALQDSIAQVYNKIQILAEDLESQKAVVFDLNAHRIEQIGSLFDAMASYPEVSNTLISATEILYADYTELLPFSDSTIIKRGIAIGHLFDAIGKQPEAYHLLDSAATKFLGSFNLSQESGNKSQGIARGLALVHLFAAIARQPEAYSVLDSAATKFLGEFNPISMNDDLTEGKARGLAISALFSGIAKQPEASSRMDSSAVRFLGIYNPSYFSTELIEVSKTYAAAGLNAAIARQPGVCSNLNTICSKYLNFDFLKE